MKLLIKKRYFDLIKSGEKRHELREPHITFVCEETGEMMSKEIVGVDFIETYEVSKYYPDINFRTKTLLEFELMEE